MAEKGHHSPKRVLTGGTSVAAAPAPERAEVLYRQVLNHIADPIFVVDKHSLAILDCNDASCRFYGYAREEFLRLTAPDLHMEGERELVLERIRGPHPGTTRREYIQVAKDGTQLTVEVQASELDYSGRSAVLTIIHDVSERDRALRSLRESEVKFRALAETAASAIYILANDRLLYVNPAMEKITGYSREELMSMDPWKLVHPDSFDLVRKRMEARIRGENPPAHYEFKGITKDGKAHWLDLTVSTIEFEGQIATLSTAVDVTERKLAQHQIEVQKIYLEQLFENAPEAIVIRDSERNLLRVNREFSRMFGYTGEEVGDRSLNDLIVPWNKKAEAIALDQQIAAGDMVSVETVRQHKDGTLVDVSILGTPIYVGGGRFDDYTIYRDIRERKKSERLQSALYRIANLASSAENLQELYASIHRILSELMYARNCYIALTDPLAGGYVFPYWVDQYDDNPGPQTSLRGLTEYVLRTGQPLLATPDVLEELVVRGEVERRGAPSLDWMGVPLKEGEHTFGVLVLQTYEENVRYAEEEKEILTFVSQQIASAISHRRGQQALRFSEARYRSLVESAVHGIYRCDLDGRFLDVNQALISMLGYDSVGAVLALDPARDIFVDSTLLATEFAEKKKIDNLEVRWRRRDGTEIAVRLNGRAIAFAPSGEPEEFELIAEDVTERRALEEQLRQAQKMEAVGCLAGGVAHDFNNLLTIIRGNAELLLDNVPLGDVMRADVEGIQKAADRAASLTTQLLAFSRQQVLAPQVLDLNRVIANLDDLLRRLLGEDIELITALSTSLGKVKADPSQIEQVVMNLAVNARDAMPRGGKLIIATRDLALDASYVREHVDVQPGEYVLLDVSDTGIGMAAETCARVFEPFFTTKELGKGTGLGLSTVYGIVKQSGGHVFVESELGRGTSFKIYLPKVASASDHKVAQTTVPAADTGTETILLVEDEEGVRGLVHHVLQRKGYTVLEASQGTEALDLCGSHDGPIHLLLTDVVLHTISGRELAEKLVGIRGQMKVLYMSGYTDDAIVQHGVLAQETAFLQKPFTTEALARKVREVLDAK